MRIGLDIGGVIIGGDGNDTFFTKDYLYTPEVSLAFSSIRNLAKEHDIFLVSKAGPLVVQKTRAWLDDREFFLWTGIDRDNLVFCRMRRQKAPIAQLLELDLFVDDRKDICDSMEAVGIPAITFHGWMTTLKKIKEFSLDRVH